MLLSVDLMAANPMSCRCLVVNGDPILPRCSFKRARERAVECSVLGFRLEIEHGCLFCSVRVKTRCLHTLLLQEPVVKYFFAHAIRAILSGQIGKALHEGF